MTTPPKIQVSFYGNQSSRTPTQLAIPRDELEELLCTHIRTNEKNTTAWAPHTVDGTRAKNNTRTVTAFIADLDDLDTNDMGWLARVDSELSGIVHSSFSHTAEHPKLRLVLWLSRPVEAKDWPRFWQAVVTEYNIPADPSCKDASRLYFAPSAPEGAPTIAERLSGTGTLDVDALLAKASEPSHASTPTAQPIEYTALPEPSPGLTGLIEVLAAHWPAKGRHRASLALSGALAREGLSAENITNVLIGIAKIVNGDDGEPYKRLQMAESSTQKHLNGEAIAGWRTLTAGHGVPLQAIDDARQAAGLTVRGSELEQLQKDLQPPPTGLPARLDAISKRETPPVVSYTTDIDELDKLCGGGVSTRQVMTIAGPPGAGKSAFVVRLAYSLESKVPVLIISTELESAETLARFAAPKLSIPWSSIVRGEIEAEKVGECVEGARIHIADAEEIDDEDPVIAVVSRIKSMHDYYGVSPVVVIDYLQDLARGEKPDAVRGKIGSLTKAFRKVAKVTNCAVVLVSTVSRGFYGSAKAEALRASDDASIYLSAAKESGDVDYDSATVLFLDVGSSTNGVRPARVAVAKARHGQTGFVGMHFLGAIGLWEAAPEALHQIENGDMDGRFEKVRSKAKALLKALEQAKERNERISSKTDWAKMVGGKTDIIREAQGELLESGLVFWKEMEHTTEFGRIVKVKVLVAKEENKE